MKSFQCDAIIFDLDGVLVDSSVVIERHWKRWTAKHGLDPDETMRISPGMRTVDAIRLIAPHIDAEKEAAAIDAGEAIDTDGVVEIDGAKRLLQVIPKGWWCVATSGIKDTAIARMRHVGLPIPEILVTAEDVARGKPDPEVYLLAAKKLQVQPTRCIAVEDSLSGIEAALSAKMHVIAVATTHKPVDLEIAHCMVESLSEIKISLNDSLKNGSSELINMPMRMIVNCFDENR